MLNLYERACYVQYSTNFDMQAYSILFNSLGVVINEEDRGLG